MMVITANQKKKTVHHPHDAHFLPAGWMENFPLLRQGQDDLVFLEMTMKNQIALLLHVRIHFAVIEIATKKIPVVERLVLVVSPAVKGIDRHPAHCPEAPASGIAPKKIPVVGRVLAVSLAVKGIDRHPAHRKGVPVSGIDVKKAVQVVDLS
jgi:hypothetical protein